MSEKERWKKEDAHNYQEKAGIIIKIWNSKYIYFLTKHIWLTKLQVYIHDASSGNDGIFLTKIHVEISTSLIRINSTVSGEISEAAFPKSIDLKCVENAAAVTGFQTREKFLGIA